MGVQLDILQHMVNSFFSIQQISQQDFQFFSIILFQDFSTAFWPTLQEKLKKTRRENDAKANRESRCSLVGAYTEVKEGSMFEIKNSTFIGQQIHYYMAPTWHKEKSHSVLSKDTSSLTKDEKFKVNILLAVKGWKFNQLQAIFAGKNTAILLEINDKYQNQLLGVATKNQIFHN